MARGGRHLTLTRLDRGRTRLQAGTGRDHALSIQDPWEDALEAPPVMSSLWPMSCGVSAQPSISSGLPKCYGLLYVCLSTGTRTQGLTLAIRHTITEPGPPANLRATEGDKDLSLSSVVPKPTQPVPMEAFMNSGLPCPSSTHQGPQHLPGPLEPTRTRAGHSHLRQCKIPGKRPMRKCVPVHTVGCHSTPSSVRAVCVNSNQAQSGWFLSAPHSWRLSYKPGQPEAGHLMT